MSARKRIIGAFATTSFGYVVTILVQLGYVPVFLHGWGPTLYGEWLLVSTIPGYLAISDLGLGSALGNDMAMAAARGDRDEAIGAFQGVGAALAGFGLLVLLPLTYLAGCLPLDRVMGLHRITGQSFAVLLVLLVGQVWLSQIAGVLHSGFRCAQYYVASNALWQSFRLVEFGAVAGTVLAGGDPIAAAAASVAARFAYIAANVVLLRLWVPWLALGIGAARLSTVRRLLHPGVMFLAFPLGFALNLQTPLLVIGMTLGPEATVVFSTARTLSRAVQQLPNIITNTIWAEMSHAFGKRDFVMVRRLFHAGVAAAFWITLAGVAALALFGLPLYRLWTHRVIELQPALFYLLLLVSFGNGVWYTASIIFTATNRHARLALYFLLVNGGLAVLCWALARVAGLDGVALALVLAEAIMALYAIPAALRIIGDRIGNLAYAIVYPEELLRQLRKMTPLGRPAR